MKKFLCFTFVMLFSLLSIPSYGADFTVKSFSPNGLVEDRVQIKASFSEPVVSDAMLGKILPEDKVPIVFDPHIAGHFVWDDEATIVFTPSEPLKPATGYRADFNQLRSRSGQLLAGKQSFTFNTVPLKVLSVRQINFSRYKELTMEINFSLPVPPQRLLGFISATSDGRNVQLFPQGQAPSKRVILKTNSIEGRKLDLKIEKGLTSNLGTLGLDNTKVFSISPSTLIRITGSSAMSESEKKGRISFYMSYPVDLGDVKGYVEVEPKRSFRVEPNYGGFAIVGDFSPRDRIKVTLKKGLGGVLNGLKKDFSRAYIFPDLDASVSFPVAGTFLSEGEDPRIAVETVNMNRLEVSAWKLYPNNIPLIMGAGYSSRQLSRNIGSVTYHLDNRLNENIRGALDLRELLKDDKGVYLLEARDGDGKSWTSATHVLTLTDLGISSRVSKKSLLVWVNSISKASPVEGAKVKVYSSSNQLLASGETDQDGLLIIRRDNPWDPQLEPSVVTVEKEDDLSFLPLSGNLMTDSGVDISGRNWVDGYESICFPCRGIFKPGETVQIKSLVRSDFMKLPGQFPLMWKVLNQRGQEVAQGKIDLSDYGTGTASVVLSPSAATGKYLFQLYVPGVEGSVLGSCHFIVEDFTPPRIEVKVDSDSDRLGVGSEVKLSMDSEYLFGAPSSGLNWEMQLVASPVMYRSTKFSSYSFGDSEVKFEPVKQYIGSGVLDEDGKGNMVWNMPDWRFPSQLELSFFGQVMEPGGRWVSGSKVLKATPDTLIGIKIPEEVEPDRDNIFSIVTVDDDDQLKNVETVKFSLYKVIDRYVMVRFDGRTRMKWQEEKTLVQDGTVKMKDGQANLSLETGEGQFMLVCEIPDGSISSSVRFSSWKFWGDSSRETTIPDRVNLTLDKKSYKPDETAKLTIGSPFSGRALFTLESGDMIEARTFDLKSSEGQIEFKVPHTWPNGWCTVQLIRPLSVDDQWGPHRALGVVRLPLDLREKRCTVSLDVAEKTLPGEKLKVKVSATDYDGNPISGDLWLALVDRGILGLTDYKTPDPWSFFTQSRRLNSRACDIYDDLMPIESRETKLLHPAGGAEMMRMAANNLSPIRARGFRLLSILKPSVPIGETGEVELSIEIPEFSGGTRLMAVMASENALGATHRDIAIARDIVVDPSMPKALAPGDSFSIPVQIMSTASKDLEVELSFKFKGVISSSKTVEKVTISPKESIVIPVHVMADECGHGDLSVMVSGDDFDFTVERETVVRPPYPRVTYSDGKVLKSGDLKVPEYGDWFPGTLRTSLYAAGTPKADLLPVISFLMDYPFGCLEQTVSSAWPLVVLPDMAEKIDPELVNEDEIKNALEDAVRRIQTMQLYDGSFSSWPSGSRADVWGSIYAAHLMSLIDDPLIVPESMMDRTLSFIRSFISNEMDDSPSLSQKAYGCYVLSLHGEAPLGWMAWLSERIGDLDDSGRVFLAGAYGLAGKKKQAISMMGSHGRSSLKGHNYSSSLRDQAIRLLVLGDVLPGSEDESFMAAGLMRSMSERLSTQEAGFLSLALGRYLERADLRPFKGSVWDGDKIVELSTGDEIALSADRYIPWKVTNDGPGKLFCSWSYSGVPMERPKPYDSGVKIRRFYEDRDGNSIDLSKPLKVGQEVLVRIEVTPTGTVRDLAVTDLLLGCLEVWSPELYKERGSVSTRREIRFDRVLFFPSYFTKTLNFGYRCRVIREGVFTVPPVSAEAMYDLSIKSLSGGGSMTVEN